ncbi:hypothetical protein PFLUV_G00134210 [Perca fluviatilis]|uniref:Secreted protein n=1 Tax=Perca fluviatilis TaxID=8168 RepID=A0A6A5EZZ2_PERFL|nr:hypothetical protein PFLUV_G00134210 [Perca fluviatilis]
MYKSVLLVLLCVQVFLLITSFTSTDAAALVTEDQQQQQQESPDLLAGVSVHDRERRRQRSKRRALNCRFRPGGCSVFGKIPNTPNSQLLALDKTRVETEQARLKS